MSDLQIQEVSHWNQEHPTCCSDCFSGLRGTNWNGLPLTSCRCFHVPMCPQESETLTRASQTFVGFPCEQSSKRFGCSLVLVISDLETIKQTHSDSYPCMQPHPPHLLPISQIEHSISWTWQYLQWTSNIMFQHHYVRDAGWYQALDFPLATRLILDRDGWSYPPISLIIFL